MVKLEHVTKKYRSGKVLVKALNDVTLEIKKGEFVATLGPSGSGKTTLLNIIGCLTRLNRGRFWLAGQEVSHLPDHFLSAVRREKIGFVFQQFNLVSGFTTWENVSLPLVPMGVPERKRKSMAMQMLEKLNLETRANFMANELSGGEQQRAAIARALINEPEVLLADEPLSNIDLDNVRMVIKIFSEFKERGKTTIASFHDSQPQISSLIDRTLYFQSGEISV
jgi:putative ABC transport system ATP-binding protein